MNEKIAVIMEFNGYTQDELQDYLTLKFGSMTKGGMTASVLSQIGYKRAKAVILDRPQLNENQQIVLEWLKNLYGYHYYQPFVAVSLFRHSFWTEKIEENYNQLDKKQQAQVLEVFSRWVQEQEGE